MGIKPIPDDSYGLGPLEAGHPDSTVAFGYDDRLQLSVGRIYTDTGKILDAETAATIGTFSPTTSSCLDHDRPNPWLSLYS